MPPDLLTAKEAAQRLGIAVTTLYGWLGASDYGLLAIRGQLASIRYFQSGRNGQGKILIEAAEVARIQELMRVVPQRVPPGRPRIKEVELPGIYVPLGRPTD